MAGARLRTAVSVALLVGVIGAAVVAPVAASASSLAPAVPQQTSPRTCVPSQMTGDGWDAATQTYTHSGLSFNYLRTSPQSGDCDGAGFWDFSVSIPGGWGGSQQVFSASQTSMSGQSYSVFVRRVAGDFQLAVGGSPTLNLPVTQCSVDLPDPASGLIPEYRVKLDVEELYFAVNGVGSLDCSLILAGLHQRYSTMGLVDWSVPNTSSTYGSPGSTFKMPNGTVYTGINAGYAGTVYTPPNPGDPPTGDYDVELPDIPSIHDEITDWLDDSFLCDDEGWLAGLPVIGDAMAIACTSAKWIVGGIARVLDAFLRPLAMILVWAWNTLGSPALSFIAGKIESVLPLLDEIAEGVLLFGELSFDWLAERFDNLLLALDLLPGVLDFAVTDVLDEFLLGLSLLPATLEAAISDAVGDWDFGFDLLGSIISDAFNDFIDEVFDRMTSWFWDEDATEKMLTIGTRLDRVTDWADYIRDGDLVELSTTPNVCLDVSGTDEGLCADAFIDFEVPPILASLVMGFLYALGVFEIIGIVSRMTST